MANATEYFMHAWTATVSPKDHSGEGVWTKKAEVWVDGTQSNNSYGHGGVLVSRPPGLESLQGTVAEIGGQNYKCAPTSFQVMEHDEQETVAKAFKGKTGEDHIIVIRAWQLIDNVMSNVETLLYWTKLMSAEYIQFGVFTAAQTEVKPDGSVSASGYVDSKRGSSKILQTPNGRTAKMETGSFPPRNLGNASPEEVNTQLLDI